MIVAHESERVQPTGTHERMRHRTVVRLRHKADMNCMQTSFAHSPRTIIHHTFTELRDEVERTERGVRELGGVREIGRGRPSRCAT